tara:strand:+ start:1323 stop:1817 length:495 start_codon:yes stop_codon:yes gene_type:complete
MKILVFGLPGSGKTWLSERLRKHLNNCAWYNADIIRKCADDWDFSLEGRFRQSNRMKSFADFEKKNGRWVICDFIAPTEETRKAFDADYTIWLDTIKEGRVVNAKLDELKKIKNLPFKADSLLDSKEFKDTNDWFEIPNKIDKRITNFMNDEEIKKLALEIQNV